MSCASFSMLGGPGENGADEQVEILLFIHFKNR
jgi:hypothetical protein